MISSLISLCISSSSEVRNEAKEAISNQQNAKLEKMKIMKEKKLEAASKKYIDKLYYHDEYMSIRCWRNAKQVDDGLATLSATGKLDEVKEQIKMKVLGLGWNDLHHAWSKNGTKYTWEELATHLKTEIIPKKSIRNIPEQPPVNLPSRKELPVLGTLAPDIVLLDNAEQSKVTEFDKMTWNKRDKQEEEEFGECVAEMQQ